MNSSFDFDKVMRHMVELQCNNWERMNPDSYKKEMDRKSNLLKIERKKSKKKGHWLYGLSPNAIKAIIEVGATKREDIGDILKVGGKMNWYTNCSERIHKEIFRWFDLAPDVFLANRKNFGSLDDVFIDRGKPICLALKQL